MKTNYNEFSATLAMGVEKNIKERPQGQALVMAYEVVCGTETHEPQRQKKRHFFWFHKKIKRSARESRKRHNH